MDTTLFTASSPPFPGWQNPAPNAYTFTLPAQGWWNTLFGGGAMKDLANFLANLVMQAIAWVMHLAILLASHFSDPGWVVNPVADKIGVVFQLGYKNVFVRLLPFLVLATALYVVWQFLRARHTKILTAVVSTALSGALIYVFFFDFAPAFKTVNNLAQAVTTQLGTAVESTAGLKAGTLYDALWDVYVLEPWEAAQFGHASQNLSDFDVSSAAVGQTYTDDQGQQQTIGAGDNWVKLFMANTTDKARQSLLGAMTSVPQPFSRSDWTSQDVQNVNPYDNIVFLLVVLLLSVPCLAFLGMMAFLLFAQAFMFLLLVFLGIVTVPVAFVPEIGWVMTLRWLREAAGYLLLRLANVMYMAATFALAEIVVGAVAVTGDESSLVLAALTDALVFLAALLFREKVFHAYIRPHVETVQGIERKQESGENEAQSDRQGGDARERRLASEARGGHRTGTLSSRFGTERRSAVGSGAAGVAAAAAGTAGTGAAQATGAGTTARQKLASAFATVVDKARNPSRASTWQERAQGRADRLIALERAAHGTALETLAHGGRLAAKAGRAFSDAAFSRAELNGPLADQGAKAASPSGVQESGGSVAAGEEQEQALLRRSVTPSGVQEEARQKRSVVEDDEGQGLSEAFEAAPVTPTDTEEERAQRDVSPDMRREADAGAGRTAGNAEVHGSEGVSGVDEQTRETSNPTEQVGGSGPSGQPAGRRPLQPERTVRSGVPVPERPDAELEDHRLAEGFSMSQANSDTSRESGGREAEHAPQVQQGKSRPERERVATQTPARPEAGVESHGLAEGFSMPQQGSDTTRDVESREPVRGDGTASSGQPESRTVPQAGGGESAGENSRHEVQRSNALQTPPRSSREGSGRRELERRDSGAEMPRLGDGFGVPVVTGAENVPPVQTGGERSQEEIVGRPMESVGSERSGNVAGGIGNADDGRTGNATHQQTEASRFQREQGSQSSETPDRLTPRSRQKQQPSALPPDPRGTWPREPMEPRGPRGSRGPRSRA
ncbi:MAG: hypothetical protein K6T31_02680 [Alicyclobacillus sp.]|nr:hypothetical protein [Alicyclobacillus sp.]